MWNIANRRVRRYLIPSDKKIHFCLQCGIHQLRNKLVAGGIVRIDHKWGMSFHPQKGERTSIFPTVLFETLDHTGPDMCDWWPWLSLYGCGVNINHFTVDILKVFTAYIYIYIYFFFSPIFCCVANSMDSVNLSRKTMMHFLRASWEQQPQRFPLVNKHILVEFSVFTPQNSLCVSVRSVWHVESISFHISLQVRFLWMSLMGSSLLKSVRCAGTWE